MIKMVCLDCARLTKCKSAPETTNQLTSHSCSDWYPLHSAVVSARQTVYQKFGAASRDGFRKKVKTMTPDKIIAAANSGDVDALQGLFKEDINPVNLMLAACNVNKDSAASIAAEYRNLTSDEARKSMLIQKLIEKAESVQATPATEEKPKPKKRSRRKVKADTAKADADKEAEKAKFIKEQADKAASAVISTDDTTLKAVAALSESVKFFMESLSTQVLDLSAKVDSLSSMLTELAKISEQQAQDVAKCNRNLSRVRKAFEGFEVELIGSGTVGSTPFLNATADWEE